MASIISAGTTSGTALNLSGDTTGNLAFTTQAGANTITIANQTGTLNPAGPTFSAYQSSSQTVSNNTNTKVLFQTELWDTNSNFASSTFTPTVAGYYQINAVLAMGSNWTQELWVSIFKNGTEYKRGFDSSSSGSSPWLLVVSGLVYCNGTTDYIEIYTYQNSGSSKTTYPGQPYCWFDGCLIRGA